MSPLGMRGSATAAVISTSELGWLPVYQMASSNVTSPERAAPGSLAERQLLTPRRPIPACLEATPSQTFGCDLQLPKTGHFFMGPGTAKIGTIRPSRSVEANGRFYQEPTTSICPIRRDSEGSYVVTRYSAAGVSPRIMDE